MEIMLKNEHGVVKQVKIGFSWTVLFFGFWPAIFRKDVLGTIYLILVRCLAPIGLMQIHPIFILTVLVAPFLYNRNYIQRLLDSGYQPVGVDTLEYLRARKFKC